MVRVSLSEAYNDRSVIKKISDLEQQKQDKLTAGEGVILDGTTISVDTSELITEEAFAASQSLQDIKIQENADAIAERVTSGEFLASQSLQDMEIQENADAIDVNTASIKSLEKNIDYIEDDIEQIDTSLNLLDQRVSQHTVDINLIDDKVDDVASDLKLKADAADLVVTNSKVSQNTSDISTKASKTDLTATNAKVAQNTSDILKRAMQSDLEETNTKVSANSSYIAAVEGEIGSATQPGSILYRITVSEGEIISLKPTVNEAIKSAVISGDGNAVYHTATTIGGTVDTDVLPTVSEDRAGVMSSSVYVALNANIANLLSRVALLEGESTIYPLTGLSDSPTDAQITSAFTAQYPNVPLSAGIRAADLARAKVWAYTGSSWILMSGYKINQASTGVLGVVMGTADVDANAGKVYVEADGSMSVVGYDTLKALIVTCQGNISALQTTVSGHTTQITNLGSDTDALKLRMTNAESSISTLQSGLSSTNANLTALTKRVTQAESDIDTAEADIDALESRCGDIETKDTQQDSSISTLDGRCTALETNVTTAAGKITALTTRVSTAEGDIDNCESRLSAVEQSAVYNSGATKAKIDQIATNATDIDAIEQSAVYTSGATKAKIDQIATNQEQINTLNTDLAAAEGDIDTLQSSVNELATGISNLGSRVSTVETVKQDKLTAGDNITIENNVISASSGGGSLSQVKLTELDGWNSYYFSDIESNFISLKNISEGSTTKKAVILQDMTIAAGNSGMSIFGTLDLHKGMSFYLPDQGSTMVIPFGTGSDGGMSANYLYCFYLRLINLNDYVQLSVYLQSGYGSQTTIQCQNTNLAYGYISNAWSIWMKQ